MTAAPNTMYSRINGMTSAAGMFLPWRIVHSHLSRPDRRETRLLRTGVFNLECPLLRSMVPFDAQSRSKKNGGEIKRCYGATSGPTRTSFFNNTKDVKN